jgi:hypothetical protein
MTAFCCLLIAIDVAKHQLGHNAQANGAGGDPGSGDIRGLTAQAGCTSAGDTTGSGD